MTEKIEMFHTLDVDGRPIYRARGAVRHTPGQLAEALGVSEDQFVLKLDPVVLARIEKQRKRRPRKSAGEAYWEHYHGHD